MFMTMAFRISIGYQWEWEEVLMIFHQCLFHSNSGLTEYPILSCKLSSIMATLVDEQRAIFNPNQAATFDAVLESVTNNQGHLFFIHTAGGCKKTFFATLLLLRLEEEIK